MRFLLGGGVGVGGGGGGDEKTNTRPSFSKLLSEMILRIFHSVKNGSGKFTH